MSINIKHIVLAISIVALVILRSSVYSKERTYQPFSPLGRGVYDTPQWSPDGRYLAFGFRNASSYDELWIYDTDTNNTTKLSIQGNFESLKGLAWENNEILYYSSDYRLYRANVATNSSQLMKIDISLWDDFTFDRNLRRFVFAQQVAPLSELMDIWAMDVSNGIGVNLTNTTGKTERDPKVSFDGKYVAYSLYNIDRSPIIKGSIRHYGLAVQDEKGKIRILDIPLLGGVNGFDWSPDSNKILFLGNDRGFIAGLFLIDLDKPNDIRHVLSVDDLKGGIARVSWSQRGELAIISVGAPGSNDLYILPMFDLLKDSKPVIWGPQSTIP